MSVPPNADRISTSTLRKLRQAQVPARNHQPKPKVDFGTYGQGLEDAFAKVFGGR